MGSIWEICLDGMRSEEFWFLVGLIGREFIPRLE